MPSRFHSRLQPRLTMLLLLLLAAATEHRQLLTMMFASAQEPQPITREGCLDKCGHTSIPFPFGMKPGCYRPGFLVICNHSFHPARAFLAADGEQRNLTYRVEMLPGGTYQQNYSYKMAVNDSLNRDYGTGAQTYKLIELVDVSAATSEARVRAPVNSRCNINDTHFLVKHEDTYLGNETGPFRLSSTRNVLVGVGVSSQPVLDSAFGIMVTMNFNPSCVSEMMGNDKQFADNRTCSGLGCCVSVLPPTGPPITQFSVGFWPQRYPPAWETTPCSYGMVVESSWYNFSTSDLYGFEDLSTRLDRGVPAVIDFAMRGDGDPNSYYCPAKGQQPPPDYACVSGNSSCSNATTYSEGRPNGAHAPAPGPTKFSYGTRLPGPTNVRTGPAYSYVCKCWEHYHGNPYIANGCQDIDECEMRKQSNELNLLYPCFGICTNKVGGYDCRCRPGMKGDAKIEKCSEILPLVAKVVIGVAAIVVVCVFIVMSLQHLKLKRFYEQNGGPILNGVKNIRIYRRKQLKQITNNYKHVIGEGHFGKVYMGTMEDKQQVAIKISIKIDKDMKKEFTDEVIIQSEMRHKNIVRLLGCCLEVDVPMLMYEYVARGSLYDVLFGSRRIDIISVDTRLGIAAGSAEGLAYMHSAVESTLRHGDVKSGNILLDQNFTPKVSDFGTTRLLARGKAEKTDHVIGDLGYIDPVYMEEGVVTQKSDVYSFGVILIELITRRPAVYDKQRKYVENFVQASLGKEARSFVDTAITSEADIKLLEMVGEVAVECLKPNLEERLDMKQVEQRLNQIIGQSAQYGQRPNYQADLSPALDDIPMLQNCENEVPTN